MTSQTFNEQLKASAIKRVFRDVQEVQRNYLPGLSICMPNSQNPLLLHANIMIQDGLYKDVLIHIIIRIPQDYPHSAPSANIAPGHPFTGNFHEHVIASNSEYGASICSDLLSPFPVVYDQKLRPSFTKDGKYLISGWSPAYSLSSILVQLQVFFANHDFPETKNLNPQRIQSMKEATQKFTFDVTIDDGTTQQVITHSYIQPYPPFTRQTPQSSPGYKNEELELAMKEESDSNSDTCDEENEYFDTDIFVKNFIKNATNKPRAKLQGVIFEEEKKNSFVEQDKESLIPSSQKVLKQQIASKLVCSISKQTIFDKPTPTLGYLMQVREASYNRLWVTPVIELNSKESFEQSFQSDIARSGMQNYPFYRTSVFGNGYNFWMPLYINKKHYEQSRDDIQSSISQIYNMVMRTRENPEPFHPKMVLMVLPPILVKTVIHMLKDDLHQSLAALDAYCQVYWLFMKLVNHYPETQQQIDEDVDKFLTQEEFRHKRKLGDLGEFMFKLSLSRRGINNTDINKALLEEFFARQVTWAKKRRPDLRNLDIENLVPTFIGASRVACQFFLIQFESAKLMVNDSVRAQLEEGYGCVSSTQLERFMDKVNWIRDNMRYSWKILINNIGLGQIITKKTQVEEMIKAAFEKESQLYSKWTVVQCETLGIGLDDWRLPKFGYLLNREIVTHYRYYKSEGELVINPNLHSHLSSYITSKDLYWLPIYINESHFERIRTSYDTHINVLYSEIARLDKSKANITAGSTIKVKVFSSVLAQCFMFIGKRRLDNQFISERKQDKGLCIAYIQLLWTFWKLLEHDVNMQKILNQEVDLFKQDNSYRESLSWKTLIEVAIKFVLSERGGEGSEGWDCFFKEIVRKYTDEAILMIDGSNHENSVIQKFGWFKQLEIKQILKTIQMTKIVLNDRYRAQLESNNGFLKEYDLDEVRSDIRQIQSHKGDDLMSPLLKIWDLKKETTAFGDMSTRIQIKINEVKKKVKTGEAFVEMLGPKFMVKINKKKKGAK